MSVLKQRSSEMIALACKLYEETPNAVKVGKRIGVSKNAIFKMLKEGGVSVPGWSDPKPRRRKFDDEAAKAIVVDYTSGMTWKELIAKYGSHQYAIREAVRRSGTPLKDHGAQRRRIYAGEEERIVEMYVVQGMTQEAIAARLRSGQGVVSRVLRANGISKRSLECKVVSNAQGYKMQMIPFDHKFNAMRTRNGYVMQHRLVMAESINRPLHPWETVHHIDGNKANNTIENLQLRQGKHGVGVVMRCRCCGSFDVETLET